MTQQALEEVRKSRELIAHIMSASPCRSSKSPAHFLMSPANPLQALHSSPLNETLKSQSQRPRIQSTVSPSVKMMDSHAATLRHDPHDRISRRAPSQNSTRIPTLTTAQPTIQHNYSGSQPQISAMDISPVSPSRNDPPSLSASFDAAIKWSGRPIATQQTESKISYPRDRRISENSKSSLAGFLKEMNHHMKPQPGLSQSGKFDMSETNTSAIQSGICTDLVSLADSGATSLQEGSEVKQKVKQVLQQSNQCPIHPHEQALYYCEETNELFCVFCAFNLRQRRPGSTIKDLKLKFHELRVHINSLGKREEKYLTRGSGMKQKLTQNKETVIGQINTQYNELRKQLEQDRRELLRQIEEVDHENQQKLETRETGNNGRLREIQKWLSKARAAQAKPDRNGFLQLIKDYQQIAGECAQIFAAQNYQSKCVDLQTFDYIPENSRLGSLILNVVEGSQRSENRDFEKLHQAAQHSRTLSSSSLANLSFTSGTILSSELQYSFGGLREQQQQPTQSLAGTLRKGSSKQLKNDSYIGKGSQISRPESQISTGNKPTMVPSRSESRTRLRRTTRSYKDLKQEGSLIEELEAATPPLRQNDKSPEREVPMNVMKRAISLAKCRVQSTPPQSAPRSRDKDSSSPFEISKSVAPPRQAQTPQPDLESNKPPAAPRFSNIMKEHESKSYNRKTPPRIPIDQIKRHSLTRTSILHRRDSSKEGPFIEQPVQNRQSGAMYYKYRRQATGSERFSPRLSRLRIETNGSPISSQIEYRDDDLQPYSEDSGKESIPIAHMPKMSKDGSYLERDESDYSGGYRLFYRGLSDSSNLTRPMPELTPKTAVFGDKPYQSSSQVMSLTPRDLLSPKDNSQAINTASKHQSGTTSSQYSLYSRENSFRAKLNRLIEKNQALQQRHQQLFSQPPSGHHYRQQFQDSGASHSSIRLIPTETKPYTHQSQNVVSSYHSDQQQREAVNPYRRQRSITPQARHSHQWIEINKETTGRK